MQVAKLFAFGMSIFLASSAQPIYAAAPVNPAIVLEADQADIDDKQGVSVYTGNVKMTRAELQIDSDKMTVYRTQQELQKIIATGAPVRLFQAATTTQKEIRGEGLRLEYDASSGDVILTENAKLHQGADDFSGNIIRYNVKSEMVKASKGQNSDQRVRIVIQPKDAASPAP